MKLAVIIPLYNETETIHELYNRLRAILQAPRFDFVVCFVDDGSSDSTLEQVRGICSGDHRFRYISLSRNFGHQVAIYAGIDQVDADLYVVMDGDLQDPPELIPELIAQHLKGYEVVYGVRRKRDGFWLKKLGYHLFYRLLRKLSHLEIPLDTGDFCLMDRKVVDQLRHMREHNMFLRGLRSWAGFNQIGIEYDRPERFAGTPKYSMVKLMKLAYDGLLSFSFVPLKFAVNIGFLVSTLSLAAIVFLVVQKIFFGIPLLGWTSTFVLILFVSGVQLFTMGILGEYIARIFDETKKRPLYIIGDQNLSSTQVSRQPETAYLDLQKAR